MLDEHLSWIPQIQNVAKKISNSIGIICISSFYLNKNSLCTLYYTLVYPLASFFSFIEPVTYGRHVLRWRVDAKRPTLMPI